MWMRAMLWLGASRQIAVINVMNVEAKSEQNGYRGWSELAWGQFTCLPRLEHVWLFVWLLQESRQITCKVETVQRAEGTRWHGGMMGGGNHILLQSGNKSRPVTVEWPHVCHLTAIRWRGHGRTAGRGGPAPDCDRQGGHLTWEEYFMYYWTNPSDCTDAWHYIHNCSLFISSMSLCGHLFSHITLAD